MGLGRGLAESKWRGKVRKIFLRELIRFIVVGVFILDQVSGTLWAYVDKGGLSYQRADELRLVGFSFFPQGKIGFLWNRDGSYSEQKKNVDLFLSILSLRGDKLWVNLNIVLDELKIISPQLWDTEIGEILLRSDLRLKEDAKNLMRNLGILDFVLDVEPASLPLVNLRFWIVPGQMKIRLDKDGMFVDKALLKVRYEILCEKRENARFLSDLNSRIQQELLPALNYLVNTSVRYKELRQLFSCYVLAMAYKRYLKGSSEVFDEVLTLDELSLVKSSENWNPRWFLDEYCRLFYNFGEGYNVPLVVNTGGIYFPERGNTLVVDNGNIKEQKYPISMWETDISIMSRGEKRKMFEIIFLGLVTYVTDRDNQRKKELLDSVFGEGFADYINSIIKKKQFDPVSLLDLEKLLRLALGFIRENEELREKLRIRVFEEMASYYLEGKSKSFVISESGNENVTSKKTKKNGYKIFFFIPLIFSGVFLSLALIPSQGWASGFLFFQDYLKDTQLMFSVVPDLIKCNEEISRIDERIAKLNEIALSINNALSSEGKVGIRKIPCRQLEEVLISLRDDLERLKGDLNELEGEIKSLPDWFVADLKGKIDLKRQLCNTMEQDISQKIALLNEKVDISRSARNSLGIKKKDISLVELMERINKFFEVRKNLGVQRGDTVSKYFEVTALYYRGLSALADGDMSHLSSAKGVSFYSAKEYRVLVSNIDKLYVGDRIDFSLIFKNARFYVAHQIKGFPVFKPMDKIDIIVPRWYENIPSGISVALTGSEVVSWHGNIDSREELRYSWVYLLGGGIVGLVLSGSLGWGMISLIRWIKNKRKEKTISGKRQVSFNKKDEDRDEDREGIYIFNRVILALLGGDNSTLREIFGKDIFERIVNDEIISNRSVELEEKIFVLIKLVENSDDERLRKFVKVARWYMEDLRKRRLSKEIGNERRKERKEKRDEKRTDSSDREFSVGDKIWRLGILGIKFDEMYVKNNKNNSLFEGWKKLIEKNPKMAFIGMENYLKILTKDGVISLSKKRREIMEKVGFIRKRFIETGADKKAVVSLGDLLVKYNLHTTYDEVNSDDRINSFVYALLDLLEKDSNWKGLEKDDEVAQVRAKIYDLIYEKSDRQDVDEEKAGGIIISLRLVS